MRQARAARPDLGHIAYLGVGSNIGARADHLRAALRCLARDPDIELRSVSSVYETEPVGGPPQGSFLNAAIAVVTRLEPQALLARLLRIEDECGRTRAALRNTPRTLDLDLLLFEERCIETPELIVPHPRMHERAFVLVPLAEIAPDAIHARYGRRVAELLDDVSERRGVRRIAAPLVGHEKLGPSDLR